MTYKMKFMYALKSNLQCQWRDGWFDLICICVEVVS